MSKRYSLFKGAGAASLRRLGVLLAMLLSTAWCSVSYADAGFYDLDAFDVKVKTSNDESSRWLYGSNGFDFSPTGADAGLSEAYDLGTLTSLYIVGYYTRVHRKSDNVQGNICESYMYYYLEGTEGDPRCIQGNFQRGDDSGNMPQVWGVDNQEVDLLDRLGISGRPGTYTVKYYFLSKGSAKTTGGCSETFYLRSNNGSNYSITFTIPSVFEPETLYFDFGNVLYGSSKAIPQTFKYHGSQDLKKLAVQISEADFESCTNGVYINGKPAWYSYEISNDGQITVTYAPTAQGVNQGYKAQKGIIKFKVDGQELNVVLGGTSYTPTIQTVGASNIGKSSATIKGNILYNGCVPIVEYGVYYSSESSDFDPNYTEIWKKVNKTCYINEYNVGDKIPAMENDLTGLMSGTKYYYILYMVDEDGNTYYDFVYDFTTLSDDYRIYISANGEDKYLGFIYETDKDPYVDYFLPCEVSHSWNLQKYENSTWSNVSGDAITNEGAPATSGLFTNAYSLSNMIFTLDATAGNVSVSKSTEGTYTYKVSFFDSEGNPLTVSGSDFVMTAEGTGVAAAAVSIGYNCVLKNLPVGATYTVTKQYVGRDEICVISNAPVSSDYTGNLVQNEVVTINYTGGDTAPVFSKKQVYWVSSGFTGTTMSDANTMEDVSCVGDNQGSFSATHSLLWNYTTPEGESNLIYSIKLPDGTSVCDNNEEWKLKTEHADGFVRYLYDSREKENTTSRHVIKRDGDNALIQVLLVKGTEKERISMNRVEGSDHVYKLENQDMSGVTAYAIIGEKVYTGGSDGENYIWQNAEQAISGISSATFTYSLKANCLIVEASGIEFVRHGEDEDNVIQVTTDGKVGVCVNNTTDAEIRGIQYSIVVTDNNSGGTIAMDGINPVIPVGETKCFNSLADAVDPSSYNLTAKLYFNNVLVDTGSRSNCVRLHRDTIYYTINDAFTYDDECALRFRTFKDAMDNLTDSDYRGADTNLKNHIVFQIVNNGKMYMGETENNRTGGDVKTPVNMITDINNGLEPEGGYKKLIVRNGNLLDNGGTLIGNISLNRPQISHIVIRNSRNVELAYLNIYGTETKKTNQDGSTVSEFDNALDIDDDKDWLSTDAGKGVENGNIVVRNCNIESSGFTCVHVSAYDGVHFEDNKFVAKIGSKASATNQNTIDWGASIKFLRSSNVSFIRNTFTGQHVTSMWLQECDSVLVMNNVFWSENKYSIEAGSNKVVFIRPMVQVGGKPTQNIGIYYNTFYISDKNVSPQADIMQFGGYYEAKIGNDVVSQKNNQGDYKNIEFKYNNCYSMDASTCDERAQDPLWDGKNGGGVVVSNNNFWSAIDTGEACFLAIGDEAYHINVLEQMCSTNATSPESLIIKGKALNLGSKVQGDISGLGADDMFTDRLNNTAIRPSSGTGWTLGAYQQTPNREPLDVIVWRGGTEGHESDWDYRSNWVDMSDRALDCLDTFSEKLTAVVPSNTSSKYPHPDGGITHYPVLPTDFDNTEIRPLKVHGEQVEAGLGVVETPSMYFKSLILEYGATILNVDRLVETATEEGEDNTRRYFEVTADYVGQRSVWMLTGNVVKPFTDNTKSEVRDVLSGDYFLNHEPVVYMRYAEVDATGEDGAAEVTWNKTFPQLDERVTIDQQFALYLPNMYGTYGIKDDDYADWTGKSQFRGQGTVPIEFQFNGRFSAEENLPSYEIAETDKYYLFNNYMPTNIDMDLLVKGAAEQGFSGVDVKYYVVDGNNQGSFVSAIENDPDYFDGVLKPKQGFLFKCTGKPADGYLRITKDMLSNSPVHIYTTRNIAVKNPYVRVLANNNGTNWGSVIKVEVDLNVNEYNRSDYAVSKAFNATTDMSYVPEIYILQDDKYYEKVSIPNVDYVVPLGINVRKEMTLTISAPEIDGINVVQLEDRATGTFYDLVDWNANLYHLEKGDYRGRFFLHLSYNAAEDEEEEGETDDPGVSTDVDEDMDASSICIFNDHNVVTVTSPAETLLQSIYVTDMSGRTSVYPAAGHYAKLILPLAQGVYIVNVLGDNASEQQKIVVK